MGDVLITLACTSDPSSLLFMSSHWPSRFRSLREITDLWNLSYPSTHAQQVSMCQPQRIREERLIRHGSVKKEGKQCIRDLVRPSLYMLRNII